MKEFLKRRAFQLQNISGRGTTFWEGGFIHTFTLSPKSLSFTFINTDATIS